MTAKSLKNCGMAVVTTSLAIAGVYTFFWEELKDLPLPAPRVIAIATLGGCVVGSLMWLAGWSWGRRPRANPDPADVVIREKTYHLSPVVATDLPGLYGGLYPTLLGSDLFPASEFERWLQRSPTCSWKLSVNDASGQSIIVGFFDMIPLSKRGRNRLEQGRREGRPIDVKDVARPADPQTAFYVGGIGGTTPYARMAILQHLASMVAEYTRTTAIVLYARPATENGKRLVRQFKFTKLKPKLIDEESYWRRQLAIGESMRPK